MASQPSGNLMGTSRWTRSVDGWASSSSPIPARATTMQACRCRAGQHAQPPRLQVERRRVPPARQRVQHDRHVVLAALQPVGGVHRDVALPASPSCARMTATWSRCAAPIAIRAASPGDLTPDENAPCRARAPARPAPRTPTPPPHPCAGCAGPATHRSAQPDRRGQLHRRVQPVPRPRPVNVRTRSSGPVPARNPVNG